MAAADNTLIVKLTADDYAAFNRYHGRKQLVFLFIFYWAVLVIASQIKGGLPLGDARSLPMLFLVGIVISVVMLGFHLWSMKAKVRKMFQTDQLPRTEQRIELMEAGIRHMINGTTIQVAWDEVMKVAETRSLILLYLATNKAVLLPKRDVADLPQVKDLLKRHVPSGKLKLKA